MQTAARQTIETPAELLRCLYIGHRMLTLEECHAKSDECRSMAERAASKEHRVMLLHMADTWERICQDLKKSNGDGAARD
jgi:hypothetical protein